MLTINLPTVPDRIGPGYSLQVQTNIGPVPNDDYFSATVQLVHAGPPIEGGSIIMHGSVVQILTMGISGFGGGFVSPILSYVAPGATVLVEVSQFHANGTLVDFLSSPGWTWDPLGALYVVVQKLSGDAVSDLSLVLSAVRVSFPHTT